MSKIGRQPIKITSAKVQVNGAMVQIDGPNAKFEHELPKELSAEVHENLLKISPTDDAGKKINMIWGLHRALIANKIKGAESGFEKKITIVGLGYKAVLQGQKVVFNLGYTHKIEMDLPGNVQIVIDRSGQNLVVKSTDKFALGNVCDRIRSFRPPEPYKGTGIIRENDVVVRKAGKAKAA